MRKRFLKAISALVMMLLFISLCATVAHGSFPWCVPHTHIGIRPKPPDGFGTVNLDGSYDVRQLYKVLVAARPDVYPFTYIRDKLGIPTASTTYSPENLLAIVNEAIRIGAHGRTMEEYARMEKLMVFLRYVRDAIGRGKLTDGYILPQELLIRGRTLDKRVPFVETVTNQEVYKPGDLFSITLCLFVRTILSLTKNPVPLTRVSGKGMVFPSSSPLISSCLTGINSTEQVDNFTFLITSSGITSIPPPFEFHTSEQAQKGKHNINKIMATLLILFVFISA